MQNFVTHVKLYIVESLASYISGVFFKYRSYMRFLKNCLLSNQLKHFCLLKKTSQDFIELVLTQTVYSYPSHTHTYQNIDTVYVPHVRTSKPG